MRHFVQYHKGEYVPSNSSFGIRTAKLFSSLEGDRIWLITRSGHPARYCLAETFEVETVDHKRRREQPIVATSRHGKSFAKPIPIDNKPWFAELKRITGNFAFGLQHIKKQSVVKGLLRIATQGESATNEKNVRTHRGAVFGDYETNRKIEAAAIALVKKGYIAKGWAVVSREREQLGYDLECRRGALVHHVEVKGVRSSICSFIITANEMSMATADPNYRLTVVTNALQGRSRSSRDFLGSELRARFEITPINFIAKLRAH